MARNRYYAGPRSDHFDGERFHSPGQPRIDRSWRDVWRWHRSETRAVWPREVPVTPARPPERSDAPRITMVGHASVLVQVAGLNILTDPVWSDRASPFRFIGPRRVTVPGIDFEHLPRIDAVLISHNHYDHLDLRTLRRLHRRDRPLIVVPLGNDAILGRELRGARIATKDWHESVVLAGGVSVSLTRANHWSARGIRDRRMALWAGYWIDTPRGSIWFAGDTGYGDGAIFHDIRERYGSPDIALIPIGAYEPRWFMAPQHVAPEEAVRVFEHLGAELGLGIHWGTFQLTNEPREEPPALLAAALAEAGYPAERFRPLGPGEVHAAAGD